MQIVSIKVNAQDIAADLPGNRATGYTMSANYQSGSCPFLLIYNRKNDYWLDLGTVLYSRNNKILQDYEIRNLGHDISKIKIEEREPEVTYIDSVSILYTKPDVELTQEAIPPIPKLAKQDGEYLILHQGESIEIDLEDLIPINSSNVRLKINGYYEILLEDNLRDIPKDM
ncbi:hypothetical protein CAL7716_106180 (plasmid) [Calothrix sp. PCC 7716]|nr:hypothetical protein CAL7716_106180 [Calothrix sp. PCC 7716]